jgi:hypothetical protein
MRKKPWIVTRTLLMMAGTLTLSSEASYGVNLTIPGEVTQKP